MPRFFTRADQDRFTLAANSLDLSGDFCTLIWVRWTAFAGGSPQSFLSYGDFATANSWHTYLLPAINGNAWVAYLLHSGGWGIGEYVTPLTPVGEWRAVVVRRVGTTLSVYVGSRSTGINEPGAGQTFTQNSTMFVGASPDLASDTHFEGDLAHFAHYTGTVSDAAVDALMAGGNPLAVRDTYSLTLQRYWPMNGTTGNEVDVVSGTLELVAVNSPSAGVGADPVDAPPGTATQVLVPDATVANTNWTANTTTAHGDTSDASDATFIAATAEGASVTLGLSDPSPPFASLTGAVLTIRARIAP